ncbi:MAG: hypothetical protein GY928_08740 [Colwellia sp.]|nr:hypothetical protein [Colwellia sp.]
MKTVTKHSLRRVWSYWKTIDFEVKVQGHEETLPGICRVLTEGVNKRVGIWGVFVDMPCKNERKLI